MNRNSNDIYTKFVWVPALLFLILFPFNDIQQFQEDSTNVTIVADLSVYNSIFSFFDTEDNKEPQDNLLTSYVAIRNNPFCEVAEMNFNKKFRTHYKNQINITFFNLPPPLQNI